MQSIQDQGHGLVFHDAVSCLSVGPGGGELDALLIANLMPKLERYVAIEPDTGNIKELVPRLIDALGDRKNFELHGGVVEDVLDNVQGHFDVVLFIHVLYYIKDFKSLVERLKRLLRPGSKVLVALTKRSDLFTSLMKECGVKLWEGMEKSEQALKIHYPDMDIQCPITFGGTFNVKLMNVEALQIATGCFDVEELAVFKQRAELRGIESFEYDVEIGMFTIS